MQMLSRQIAAVFIPVMEKLIDVTRRATDWSVSYGAQQDQVDAGAGGRRRRGGGDRAPNAIPVFTAVGAVGSAVMTLLIGKATALNIALGGIPLLIAPWSWGP